MEDREKEEALSAMSKQLRETITHLYDLELMAAGPPAPSTATNVTPAMHSLVHQLTSDFASFERFRGDGEGTEGWTVPQDVMEYIEAGRNPNVYTRQFSEAVQRENQNLNGKMAAYRNFANVLAKEINARIPGLEDDVQRALVIHVPEGKS